MKYIITIAIMMSTVLAEGQDIASFNDDFDTNSIGKWKSFHEDEGWPNHVRKMNINETSESCFYLEPEVGFWYGEVHAGPFYFQEIPGGDFTVITRIKVEGHNGITPEKSFSLAGIMIRTARPEGVSKEEKGHENWLFMSTGYAKGKNAPQFETKVTLAGKSKLKIYPAKAGWVELGITKQGSTFNMAYKKDGNWVTVRSVENPNMNKELQVGFIAYTDFNPKMKRRYLFKRKELNTKVFKDGDPDVKASFDYIRFYKPEELAF